MKHLNSEANDLRHLTNVLYHGAWGTVGPEFFEAGKVIAEYTKSAYGLVTFSASAALETVLRGFTIAYGDEVIVAAWSDPLDAMVTAAVGATPVFADVCPETLTLTSDSVAPRVTERTRAVIADLPAGNPCDAKALAAFCRERGLRLILNLNDAWGTAFDGVPIHRYADAAVINMADGTVLDVGLAGAVITDDRKNYDLFYAYHNCGRPVGEGCTLTTDDIIGGDLRVAEWQASLIKDRLARLDERIAAARERRAAVLPRLGDGFIPVKTADNGISSCTGTLVRFDPEKTGFDLTKAVEALKANGLTAVPYYPAMHTQPFWETDYYEKLTGKSGIPADAAYPCSAAAAATVLCVTAD